MRRLTLLFAIVMMFSTLGAVSATAGSDGCEPDKTKAGELYLCTKNPDTWDVVEAGAWAKFKHTTAGDEFKFGVKAHGLTPDTSYTLIHYTDPWPGTPVTCFGDGFAKGDGNLDLKGSTNLDADLVDAKIWLVLTADVDCGNGMTAWNPTDYLFEYNLIDYHDTNA
jgi:hypothetical protein